MGLIVEGKWVDKWYDTKKSDGHFKRQQSQFRNWITAQDDTNPSDTESFKAEAGRYHLYVSLACPWAHRTLIFRQLKGLTDFISVSVVDPLMLENGWELDDPLYNFKYLYQLYLKANKDYEGRVTVPVLWDKKTETIVSNESADIIRMFNSAFNSLTKNSQDYYPNTMHAHINDINDINERIYHCINNGVYKTGFATTQTAYEASYKELFDALDWVDGILSKNRYLTGDKLTEADWRLFTTLIRFDAVYFCHFKCNRQLIAQYSSIAGYVRELYQISGIAETVNFGHIKQHYFGSHKSINPTGIVPIGPELNFDAPHGRGD